MKSQWICNVRTILFAIISGLVVGAGWKVGVLLLEHTTARAAGWSALIVSLAAGTLFGMYILHRLQLAYNQSRLK